MFGKNLDKFEIEIKNIWNNNILFHYFFIWNLIKKIIIITVINIKNSILYKYIEYLLNNNISNNLK